MYQTMNVDSKLLTVIDSLRDCLSVGSESKGDPDKGYPYAYGYNTAGIRYAIDSLETVVDEYRSLMCENNQ